MKKLTLTLIALPLLLQACASTPLQGKGKAAPPAFGKNQNIITVVRSAGVLISSFNRNDDYVIDKAEFTAGRDKAFDNADRDRNGNISSFEMGAWRLRALGSKDAAPMSMYFDADFNQIVTREEFNAAFSKLFANTDIDADGSIMFHELIRVASRPSGKAQGKKSGKKGQKKKGKGGGGGRGQHSY